MESKYRFLELAIKRSKNNQIKVKELLPFENYNDYTILEIIKPLKEEGLIDFYMGGLIVIKESAKIKISSLKKEKITSYAFSVIKWIVGILTALITAYLMIKLGLKS